MLASIEKLGNGGRARFERYWHHPVEDVWAWITENEKLSQWFPELRMGELRKGGFMQFDMGNNSLEKLEITAFQDASLLEFAWWEDSIRFELQPETNGCRLVLIETISKITDHTPKDLAGWHVCLDVISALMDGRAFDRSEEWKKWYKKYIQAFE